MSTSEYVDISRLLELLIIQSKQTPCGIMLVCVWGVDNQIFLAEFRLFNESQNEINVYLTLGQTLAHSMILKQNISQK